MQNSCYIWVQTFLILMDEYVQKEPGNEVGS
jgi:hypothetical protein